VVKWANFVQPKSVEDVIAPIALRPIKQAYGGPIKQAQDDLLAKTQQIQIGDSNHLKTQGLSRSCERGEGSSSNDFTEKSMLVAPCTGKMGGDFSTSNEGSEMAVQTSFVSMGYPGSSAEVGVPSTVSVADDPVMDFPISGVVEVSCILNSDDQPSFIDTVDSSKAGCSTDASEDCQGVLPLVFIEQNHFSPISELVLDSFEEETLLLN